MRRTSARCLVSAGNNLAIEITLTRLIGKWKTSQNRPVADQSGVISGLRASDDAIAQAMAAAVERSQKA